MKGEVRVAKVKSGSALNHASSFNLTTSKISVT